MATWTLIIWIGVFGNNALTLDGFESKPDCEKFLEELIVLLDNAEDRGEYEIGGNCVEKNGVVTLDD